MMNGGSCVHSDVTDINLQVDYISQLQYTLPLKKPSGRFSILHHTNTSYISSSRSSEGDGGGSQVVAFFFSFLLISAVNIGVRAARPSPQDPPPSAPATASTSTAAMHEAHNLQDVSLLMCVRLFEPACMYGVWWHMLYMCVCLCVCVPAVAAMHEVPNLKRVCWWHLLSQAKHQYIHIKRHVILITSPVTSAVYLTILQTEE